MVSEKTKNKQRFGVIFVTLLAACSSTPLEKLESADPITRAGLMNRPFRDPDLTNAEALDAQSRRAVQLGMITLGMEPSDVVSVFGHPRKVEFAGDPNLGNQRWVYFADLSDRGEAKRQRIVYFEKGRVSGWETVRIEGDPVLDLSGRGLDSRLH
jgi:hypothetical protein